MISVVIPVYRNATTLRALAGQLVEALGPCGAHGGFEILLVLDAPPDDSPAVAAALAAEDGRIGVITLPQNVGQQRAVLAGLANARGEVAVVMDADLQDPPAAVPALLAHLESHGDEQAVCGVRANRFASAGRAVTSGLFKAALHVASGGRIPRHAGLFLGLRRSVDQELARFADRDVHVLALLAAGGVRVGTVPVKRATAAGSSYSGAMRLRTAWKALRTLLGVPAVRPAAGMAARAPAAGGAEEGWEARLGRRRALFTLGVAAGVFFGLRMVIAACSDWDTADEAWMLQVTLRTSQGEALYRDVFLGVFPLSIWLCRLACVIFGYGALTIKGVSAAIQIGVFAGCHRFLAALGKKVSPWVLGIFMLALTLPVYPQIYSELAACCGLWAGVAYMCWRRQATLRRAALIGVCLGLAVAAKYTAGGYVSLVCAGLMLMTPQGRMLRRAAHVLAAAVTAAMVVALFLTPVALQGNWQEMMGQCFGVKGDYIRVASYNFFQGFAALGVMLKKLPHLDAAEMVGLTLTVPLSLLAAPALLAAVLRQRTWQVGVAGAWAAAMLAAAYPRADPSHVSQALGGVIVLLAVCGPAGGAVICRGAARLGVGISAALLILVLAQTGWRLASPEYRFAQQPYLRGLILRQERIAWMNQTAAALRTEPEPTFILSHEASGLALLSGLRPASAYDYPLVNAMGPRGRADVMARIRDGRIQTVVLDTDFQGASLPQDLRDMIVRECPLIRTVGTLEIRRSPGRTNP